MALIYTPYPWKYGEHVSVIGRTGSGKTMLIGRLLENREYAVSLRTKADKTDLPGRKVRLARDLRDPRYRQFILQPSFSQQYLEIAKAIDMVWKEGGWTLNVDELFYVEKQLHLGRAVDMLLTQGRSKDITVICGMQRPVEVSRFAISQSTHTICFFQEGRDIKTVVDATSPRMGVAIANLKRYEFVWYYQPTGDIWTGKLQDLIKQREATPKELLANV